MFQIKRHFFIGGDLIPSKDNSKFSFPETFYPDRRMYKNRANVKVLQKESKSCKQQIKLIKEQINRLTISNNQKITFSESFDTVIQFLDSDDCKELCQVSQNTFNEILKITEQLKLKITELEKKISEINEKLSNLYKDYQESSYFLHSILIHEGAALSGHYYAYIFDLENEI